MPRKLDQSAELMLDVAGLCLGEGRVEAVCAADGADRLPVAEDCECVVAAVYVAKCPDVDLIDAVYIGDCYNSTGTSTNSPKP